MKWRIEIESDCGIYHGNVTNPGTEIIISFPFETHREKKDVEDFLKAIGCSFIERTDNKC